MLFLVDQSTSMAERVTAPKTPDLSKARSVANLFNKLVWDLILANSKGEEVLDRCHVGVITYGHTGARTAPGFSGLMPLPALATSPNREEIQITPRYDGIGGFVDVEVRLPVWLDPMAYGKTPMCSAFQMAKALLDPWVQTHPGSCPPIVFNISDGIATDGDPLADMQALQNLSTATGPTLVFNILLAGVDRPTIAWPTDSQAVEAGPLRGMIEGSSALPNSMRLRANQAFGLHLQEGARGVVINAGILDLVRLLDIGSPVAHV
ncbi:hypothetical protein GETHOR_08010 [Geothrix oryzae]|uniref:VWFA domain-containing protein n=1 Tax=Geothrix oryzae TaxID=2927975 RepID=A0ABN6UVY7_9BACT|nr:hypothetical protein [Geothrix oryzae]BDU68700.1 hypothetical protein GETHOR_08010 [Geothrix oryzae]